ncbi:glucosamine inositolphosphorylceramide transferase family protein [Edaphobacter bradus]|uniref:glucosamine inositolphosphorylceramide transferase family protein n=1 Tax=Edaphobacter bradus TaxID=2259016 RepID=UPI0021DF58F7|nr:hypothetical protein [Edaphobacter bradus]
MSSVPVTAATGGITQPSPVPLKVGVVLRSSQVPGWVYYLLGKLIGYKAVELVLVVVDDDSKVAVGAGRGPILFRFWAGFDRWFRRTRTDALRLRDWHELRSDSVTVVMLRASNTAAQSELDIAALKEASPGLLLYFGDDALGAEVAACARQGMWSVQQVGPCGTAAIPSQFWDMYEGNCISRYGPQVVEQTQNRTRILYRPSPLTNFLSLALNQNAAFWEVADFLATQLNDAARLQTDTQLCPEVNASQHLFPRTMGNMRMAGFLMQWARRILRHEFKRRLFREQWTIALQPKSGMSTVNCEHGFRIVRPPRDRFYADPFLVERNGRNYVFFEDYKFASRKGLISCCELDAEGNCSKPRVVLERKYHLSYPFLFTWQGNLYMIPETRDNRTIEMYRASDFPYSWVHEAVLMSDVAATDSTLLYYHEKWWLFTAGVLDHASPHERLFLFFAESPLGPWTAHPKNPIVSDARHARPAGCLYFDNGQLIRPGQDCSKGYGYATQLHQVSVLSETDYHETLLTSIPPDRIPGSIGIHTFNQNDEFRVIDCNFLIPRFDFNSFASAFHRVGGSVRQLGRS